MLLSVEFLKPLVVQDLFLVLLVVIAAYTDLRFRKIPDRLTVPHMIIGLVLSYVAFGLVGLKASGIGLFVGLAILIVPCELGAVGGGDAKLLIAVGALEGASFVILSALFGFIVGGIMSIAKLAQVSGGFSGFLRSVYTGSIFVIKIEDRKREENVPLGVGLAIGCVFALICRCLGADSFRRSLRIALGPSQFHHRAKSRTRARAAARSDLCPAHLSFARGCFRL